MNSAQVNQYARMADHLDRDPIGPDGTGRAIVANGRGFKGWRRFHQGEPTVWVENSQGQRYELTVTQNAVYVFCRSAFGKPITMRALAQALRVSPSTVSRAMVKLASFGLIAYLTGRGRSAMTVVIERAKDDGMDRFRRAAKAKVWSWRLAAEKRAARLAENVAHYIHDGRRGTDSLTEYLYSVPSNKSATIRAWTPDELREAGIL